MPLEDKKNDDIDTSNIFEELSEDSDLKQEVKGIVESQDKDLFYYLSSIWWYLQTIFWLFLFILVLLYGYIFIQDSLKIKNNNILDPFCMIFLWDVENTNTFCSSIASLNEQYSTELKQLKENQTKEIISILEQLYKLENFLKTKEVIFLKNASDLKTPVLKILEEFDTLKNTFEPVEKEKIKCYDIEIDHENIFQARCDVFSAWYESEIKGFDGTDDFVTKWTSISIANSFLNFIEKTSKHFTILDRQKIFSSQDISWDRTWFTNKTTFYIKLKYIPSDLSL